jgi:hypothetical protein
VGCGRWAFQQTVVAWLGARSSRPEQLHSDRRASPGRIAEGGGPYMFLAVPACFLEGGRGQLGRLRNWKWVDMERQAVDLAHDDELADWNIVGRNRVPEFAVDKDFALQ